MTHNDKFNIFQCLVCNKTVNVKIMKYVRLKENSMKVVIAVIKERN